MDVAVRVVDATPDHLTGIWEIYNEAVINTTASWDLEPVSLESRRVWMAERQAAGFPILVAERDGEVLGFASYGTYRAKAGFDTTVEHSIYCAPAARGLGVGTQLMEQLIERARQVGIHVMLGVLDADNTASLSFHRRFGFVESATVPEVGYKFGRWLTMTIASLTLPTSGLEGDTPAEQ